MPDTISPERATRFFESWASNRRAIYGAGTPAAWKIQEGGGLQRIGLLPGQLVGQDPREAFRQSGPDAIRAFEDVVERGAHQRRFRGVYPTPEGGDSHWDVVLLANNLPGHWHFYALEVDPETDEPIGGDTRAGVVRAVLSGLFGGIDGLREGGLGTWAKTMSLLFMVGFTLFWVFSAVWGQAPETMESFLTGTARIVEAAASVVPDQLTTIEEQTIEAPAGSTAVERLDVEADNVEVRSSTAQPPPPQP